ncbi:MAG: TerB family tellurite resistance protein [Pseudomonadota bacterium]
MEAKVLLHRLIHAFDAPKPEPLPEPDEKLALGALMVRVAMSDHQYELSEISKIDRLFGRLYGLKPIEAAKMRATSEKLEKQAPETDRFAVIIRETVSFEARVDALEALWEVVMADGDVAEEELRVIEAARNALGLSEADSERARQVAEAS